MEFGLLGPLVVRAGELPVVVSAAKQRVLLAALLVRANQVVPAAELAGFVWEGGPPGTARVTLQNYVKRLRQGLGAAGYERIVTRPAGYAIEVGPGELDLAKFTELAGAARSAGRAGKWERASSQLGEALGLWRGEPLADVPSAALRAAEVPRLAELRLTAAEARAEAELALGRHAGIIGELQALVAGEPLRERLWELLMLALYRSGQQAAALAAYRQAWRVLVDQVGIEPGPGLREMNQKILQSDDALLLPGTAPAKAAAGSAPQAPAPEAGVRPDLLPSALPDFTGRAAELAALSALPTRPGQPVVITAIGGTAGVGKTALAVHWAQQAASQFPDGQLYVNLRGFGPGDPLPPSEALRAFLDALQVSAARIPARLDRRCALYRSLLEHKKILILLDNARDADQVRPLLPATPEAQVLITSRNELASLAVTDGARQISLDVLTCDEARHMLAARIGPGRIADEPEAVGELIGLCARLPLALAITAARAAAHPGFTLAALAAELRDARGRLDALSTGEDVTDVRAVFSWSCRHLGVPAARMFRLLGLHPGPDLTAEAAASLAGLAVPEARRLLRELARAHLLSEPVPGRYAFHDLLRAYAAEQARRTGSHAERDAAIGRVLDYYLHTAAGAALLLDPSMEPAALAPPRPDAAPGQPADHRQALSWFEAERQVLLAAVTLAAESGFDTYAWQLPWAMAPFLHARGHYQEQAAAQRTALAAATRLGDAAAQAVCGRLLGGACISLGDHDQARAHLTSSLMLYQRLGNRLGQARIHYRFGTLAERQGRYSDELGHLEQALRLYRAVGDKANEAGTLNAIGWTHGLLGDYQQARALCRQALTLSAEIGHRLTQGYTWDSLGYAEHHLGNLAEAAACYQHALSIAREAGERYLEALALTHLGDTRQAAGELAQARQAWQQALAILEDIQDPDPAQVRDKLRQLDRVALRR